MEINKNNRFYKHRMEIKKISEANHVDAGVATSMLVKQKGWTDHLKEENEWMNIMRHYQTTKCLTLADLFK
jgi:hypothetical protein